MTARVLVVDDLPTNVKLLEARLTAEYFEVVCAASGDEAIAAARAAQAALRKLAAGDGDADFLNAKIATARFFADHYLSTAMASRDAIIEGSAGVLAMAEAQF